MCSCTRTHLRANVIQNSVCHTCRQFICSPQQQRGSASTGWSFRPGTTAGGGASNQTTVSGWWQLLWFQDQSVVRPFVQNNSSLSAFFPICSRQVGCHTFSSDNIGLESSIRFPKAKHESYQRQYKIAAQRTNFPQLKVRTQKGRIFFLKSFPGTLFFDLPRQIPGNGLPCLVDNSHASGVHLVLSTVFLRTIKPAHSNYSLSSSSRSNNWSWIMELMLLLRLNHHHIIFRLIYIKRRLRKSRGQVSELSLKIVFKFRNGSLHKSRAYPDEHFVHFKTEC